MSTMPADRGRMKLLGIAALFLLPLAFAAWMYFGERNWQPAGRTNAGELLEPIISLNDATEGLNVLTDGATDGHWAVIYADRGPCAESCQEALYRMRQTRLMLANDMSRVERVFLHGDIAPDTVWIEEEHAGLITLTNPGLSQLLEQKRSPESGPGGLYLVDPLGNLVMYFPAALAPEDMVSDIEHLLDLSRIG